MDCGWDQTGRAVLTGLVVGIPIADPAREEMELTYIHDLISDNAKPKAERAGRNVVLTKVQAKVIPLTTHPRQCCVESFGFQYCQTWLE